MSDPSKEEQYTYSLELLSHMKLLSHMNCEFCQAAFKCGGFFFLLMQLENCVLTAGFS